MFNFIVVTRVSPAPLQSWSIKISYDLTLKIKIIYLFLLIQNMKYAKNQIYRTLLYITLEHI